MTQYENARLLINGAWLGGETSLDVVNPATGRPVGKVPVCTESQLKEAVEAAHAAFQSWRLTAPVQRARILQRAASLLRERIDVIAHTMMLEQGKPLAEARAEVLRGCDNIEWDASEAMHLDGRTIAGDAGTFHYTVHQPVGAVAAFTPWNYPFGSPARKLASALGAGCTVILKAAEETPATAAHLVAAFTDAGVPAGAINLVFGKPAEISAFLIDHPLVRLISFTGSVAVGKALAARAGGQMKPVVMELGGHAPVIVCADADPVQAARISVAAKIRNAGQICISPSRFLVDQSIFETFTSTFGDLAAAIRSAAGDDPASQMGPLSNARRLDAILELVEDALQSGGTLLCGGHRQAGEGFFFPLTVLANVPAHARIMREEPFGPIAVINKVSSLDEAIAVANSLPVGLAAYAFTDSQKTIQRLATNLECGALAINQFSPSSLGTPFGGVKDSGIGREGGSEGVAAYTTVKKISHFTA
jgi:succinate-semialdehyde dehydrogenase/glutarate-semialdehyde dehydrogenase